MIRSDKWPLQVTADQRHCMQLTLQQYRAFCRALSIVVLANWPALSNAPSFAGAVERLIHPTRMNPAPRHYYFARQFYKFPSYLRRAAIEFVKGQVSSYLTRYDQWQTGQRRRANARPPVFNPEAGCYPALYRGQLFKLDDAVSVVSLKLWDGREWLWHDVSLKRTRSRHLLGTIKSPSLIVAKGRCHLSVPIGLSPQRLPDVRRVCAVDVGINTLATASIVLPDGTVVARRFFQAAADIDRRDRRLRRIRAKARKTGKLGKGFCRGLYRKAQHINEQVAQLVSRRLVQFALDHQANIIVLENLKGWRPSGGRRRSSLRQKFHGWLHRRLTDLVSDKFTEAGGKVNWVHARGTSAWAYDGSGRVKRDAGQYEMATFASGKRYNADLNASYNIGARYWAPRCQLTRRKDGQVSRAEHASDTPRIPVTLSSLWLREREAPHLCKA